MQVKFHLSADDAINLIAAYEYDEREPDKTLTKSEIENRIRASLWSSGHPVGSEPIDMHGSREEESLEWADGQLRRFYPEWFA